MARTILATVLAASLAIASPATSRTLWQDTVVGTSSGSTADEVVTTGDLVVAGGKIQIGDHTEALIRAYDATSGTLRWESQPHVVDATEAISALAEADGRVFATVTVHRFTTASEPWVVRAFDAATGTLLWEEDREESRAERATGLAAVGGRLVVAGRLSAGEEGTSTVVRAYDAATGTLLWQDVGDSDAFRLDTSIVATRDGRVFVGDSSPPNTRIRAYDTASGVRLWSAEFPSGSLVELGTSTDRVFVSASVAKGGGEVRAYDANTGSLAWQIALPPRQRPDRGPVYDIALAPSDDALYVGTTRVSPESSDLAAYDAATGDTRWSIDDSGAAWGLTLDGGRLYAGPALHGVAVHAFDAATGALRWRSPRTDPGRTIAVAARDGVAFAAGFVGPPLQSFHVAAFDGSRGVALRPIVPNGRRLPITR